MADATCAAVSEFLVAYYGTPQRADSDSEHMAFRHSTEEAARAFAFANGHFYGHSCEVEERPDGWHSVIDLRPMLKELEECRG